ncbi:hypothetical protein SPRG_10234 [Saprolegnia parasitica CBS 223.65]|uniref:EF-hand domain-containing protein n=1 Tax=Saprolegnia parasitica (strain CBS 223.65) TaxID=695850 RepID=A0A067C6F3_SAPPC|nr:hypothetical protein SPRG_10234 [Saprolegnia parasitica CBS 223.65]KDO24700.1 hypothetical protein SPRG_10234 [Saprolegnia parasitica CBS 223.65]|eukprot:XP_012204580.1 hypothetical protein SPRG_10234 [Saprolegnia parasitica CBS 223.65]
MGAAGSVVVETAPPTPVLTPRVLAAAQTKTRLAPDELEILGSHFRRAMDGGAISSEPGAPGIDVRKFQGVLGLPEKESLYVDRIFALMDTNKDGLISFDEFTHVVTLLSTKAPLAEKIAFSFAIMDLDGDGKLSKTDVHDVLLASISENSILLTNDQVALIIERTFADVDVDADGCISLDEYSALVGRSDGMLTHLTLNLSYLLNLTTTPMAVLGEK